MSASRSLLPRRSLRQSAKRAPRNSASLELVTLDHRAHGAVEDHQPLPQQRAERLRPLAMLERLAIRPPCASTAPRPQPERMADRVGEFGAIQGVEMELLDAVLPQALHLLDRHVRGDHAARVRIVVEAVEARAQPVRNGRAAALGETQQSAESG